MKGVKCNSKNKYFSEATSTIWKKFNVTNQKKIKTNEITNFEN